MTMLECYTMIGNSERGSELNRIKVLFRYLRACTQFIFIIWLTLTRTLANGISRKAHFTRAAQNIIKLEDEEKVLRSFPTD